MKGRLAELAWLFVGAFTMAAGAVLGLTVAVTALTYWH